MDLLRIPRRFRYPYWPPRFRMPPTKNQSLRKCHQWCCACKNAAHDGRVRPPDTGEFLPFGKGLRWWCHDCIAQGHPDCSRGCRGKATVRRWLVDHEIRHVPLAQLGGHTFDFRLPAFRLLIQVVKPHDPAERQQRTRLRQDEVARRRGHRLLRVYRDDADIIEQVRQAILAPRPR